MYILEDKVFFLFDENNSNNSSSFLTPFCSNKILSLILIVWKHINLLVSQILIVPKISIETNSFIFGFKDIEFTLPL